MRICTRTNHRQVSGAAAIATTPRISDGRRSKLSCTSLFFHSLQTTSSVGVEVLFVLDTDLEETFSEEDADEFDNTLKMKCTGVSGVGRPTG
jgi:hypothetical protein